MNIDKHIGKRIKLAREDRGFTQAALGDLIGASEVQVSRYESGGTPVKPSLQVKLAKALRVEVTYFLEGL